MHYLLCLFLTALGVRDTPSEPVGVTKIQSVDSIKPAAADTSRRETGVAPAPLQDTQMSKNPAMDLKDILMIIATWILAGIGFYQAAISRRTSKNQYEQTALLIRSSQDQLSHSRQMTQKELRAYVSVKAVPKIALATIIDDNLLFGGLVAKNNGQTPADNFRGYWHTNVDYPEKVKFEASPVHPIGTATLGKDCEFLLSIDDHKTDQKTINALKSGKALLYIWGRLLYDDAFGSEHFTAFRIGIKWEGDNLGHYFMLPEGNEAN